MRPQTMIMIFVMLVTSLTTLSCKKDEPCATCPPTISGTLKLDTLLVDPTEVRLKLSTADTTDNNFLRVVRDDTAIVFEHSLSHSDTTIVDRHLLPSNLYRYRAYRMSSFGFPTDTSVMLTLRTDTVYDNSEGLVPLKVGNRWISQFYFFDTSGHTNGTHPDTVRILRDTIIGNERWYKVPKLKPSDVDYLDWYTNRSDGIWVLRRVISGSLDTAFAYLTFKYPAMEGEQWGNIFEDSTRVVSLGEVIETPSGTDTCIRYRDHLIYADRSYEEYYFAPGKGRTLIEVFTKTQSGRWYIIVRRILLQADIQ